METNKFLVERKLAGFSFSPSPSPFFFYHSPRFFPLLTNKMKGTGYMDIDARKQQFTALNAVSAKKLEKNYTYVAQAALDNLNNKRLLVKLIEM